MFGIWNVLAKFQTCISREHEIEEESEIRYIDHGPELSSQLLPALELFSQPLDLTIPTIHDQDQSDAANKIPSGQWPLASVR